MFLPIALWLEYLPGQYQEISRGGISMKILHITSMNPLSLNSGIPAVLINLTEAQNKNNITASVLSLKDKSVSRFNNFIYIPMFKLFAYLKKSKPDIIVFHSFFHIEFSFVAILAQFLDIPYFLEPHGSFGKSAMKKSYLKKKLANITVFYFLIKNAYGFIFTNEAEKKDSEFHSENEFVIPNGVQTDTISKSKSNTVNEEPIFYYLGRFDINHKGLDYLFDALEILDNSKNYIRVKIYGTGNSQQIRYVDERIKQYRIIEVTNEGTIYGEDKENALNEANILLLTSRYEGSPMTVLDGFCYGNPCVVTPGTNVSEEAVANCIGWEAELNPKSIAETILKAKVEYMQNSSDYITRCKEYVLLHYTWDTIASKCINLFNYRM